MRIFALDILIVFIKEIYEKYAKMQLAFFLLFDKIWIMNTVILEIAVDRANEK